MLASKMPSDKLNNWFLRVYRKRASADHGYNEKLDLRGYQCPLPIVETSKKLRSMQDDQTLFLLCTDPVSEDHVKILLGKSGDELIDSKHVDNEYHYWIRKSVRTA